MRAAEVAGASCATRPVRLRRGKSMRPDFGARSPMMSFNKVDLPLPLRPTRPNLTFGNHGGGALQQQSPAKTEYDLIQSQHRRLVAQAIGGYKAPPNS